MSANDVSLMTAARLYARLTLLRLRRGKLLWVCVVMSLLPVLGTGVLALMGHWGRPLFDEIAQVYFRFLVPFIPTLLASPMVAEELEQRTFTFVFARPAPRSALVLGKFWAVAAPMALVLSVSLLLSWVVALISFPSDYADTVGHLLRAEAALVLGVFAYAGIAALFGSWFTRHPFVAVLFYVLIIETGIGAAPVVVNMIAVSWHLRNIAQLSLPDTFLAGSVPAWVSALVPLFFGGLGLLLAVTSVKGAEYHAKE